MKTLLLIVWLLPTSPLEGLRIYVRTDQTAEFVDDAMQRRLDTVKDLQQRLAKRKALVVESEDVADLILDVQASAKMASGTVTTETGPDYLRDAITGKGHYETSSKAELLPTIVAVLRLPGKDYTTTFTQQKQAFWTDLADYIIRDLEKWVSRNGKMKVIR